MLSNILCRALVFTLANFAVTTPASAQVPLAEIPFKYHGNGIIVPMVLNGRDTLHLLLDTGWGPLALINTTAARLGLKVEPARTSGDYPITSQVTLGRDGAIKRNPRFEVFATAELTPVIGPHDGVLSTEFFRDLVLQIDYPRQLVRFFAKSPVRLGSSPNANQGSVPMVFSPRTGALPFTDSVLVDGKPVRTLFDTGGAGRFLAMPQMVQRLGLKPVGDSVGAGLGMLSQGKATQAPLRFTRVRQVALGPLVVDTPRVIIAPGQIEGTDWGLDLNIGTGWMRNFVVTFDYVGRRVTFERPTPP